MSRQPAAAGGVIEWGVVARTHAGEQASGDRSLVEEWEDGALLAVVDGAGHGQEASDAAEICLRMLQAHPREPLDLLFRRCHEGLRGTRGVALSLAALDMRKGTLTWAGIGNVEGVILRADPKARPQLEYLLHRGGLIGSQISPPRPSVLPIRTGDVLVLATDGVRQGFTRLMAAGDSPRRIAERILERHASGADDALVLVVRFVGELA